VRRGEDGTEEEPFVTLLVLAGDVRFDPPPLGGRLGEVEAELM